MSQLGFDFRDSVVMITGAANGIGHELAVRFGASGASLILVDKSEAVTHVSARLGEGHLARILDVTDEAGVGTLIEEAICKFGKIDVLVNNAGIGPLSPAESMDASTWDVTQAVNLRGVFFCCRGVGRHMLEAGYGRIVNLASQAANVGLEGHLAYCASKSGVLGLTRTLALEWGPRGITTNAVSPTVVDTELGRYGWAGEKGERMKALIPTRRFATPTEIVHGIMFLASREAAMINGADLRIDGGYTAC